MNPLELILSIKPVLEALSVETDTYCAGLDDVVMVTMELTGGIRITMRDGYLSSAIGLLDEHGYALVELSDGLWDVSDGVRSLCYLA